MAEIPAERSRLARFAALRLLFGRNSAAAPGYDSLESSAGEEPAAQAPPPVAAGGGGRCACLRAMSAARRTFCLVVAFDLILSFILWGIFVKTRSANKTLVQNFLDEVVYYSIKTSLFDTFVCGVARFAALTLAYAIYRLRNPSVIAVTTFVTCVFVIVKVFSFQFGSNLMCYIIFVEQFLIAWVETWLLDFRVLPAELAELDSTARVLVPRQDFDSPFHTPEEGSEPSSPPCEATTGSYEEQQYRKLALAAWDRARTLLSQRDGWKAQSTIGGSKRSRGAGAEPLGSEVLVYSRDVEKLGKVLRAEARIDASPLEVFEVTTLQLQTSPSWNKTVIDCQVLQVLDDSTDVTYNVTAPAGAGVVQSRDFVGVRHWRRLPDTGELLSAACPAVHPRRPPDGRYVRGENRLSAVLYGAEPSQPDVCRVTMLLSTDIKGWIPQVVVDQSLAGVMVEFMECLRGQMAIMRGGRGGYQASGGEGGAVGLGGMNREGGRVA